MFRLIDTIKLDIFIFCFTSKSLIMIFENNLENNLEISDNLKHVHYININFLRNPSVIQIINDVKHFNHHIV